MANPNAFNKTKNKPFWKSELDNSLSFIHYYERLTELAVSMFEWVNLPKEIDERYLELSLYCYGKIVFFRDEALDEYVALPCTVNGGFNMYGIPNERIAIGYNGYQHRCNKDDSVIVYNNYLHSQSRLSMENYAKRLSNLERTIDVNANAQKTPILITCDESMKLTMQAVYQKYEGNIPAIFGYKNLHKDDFNVLTTEAPYVADKIYTLKMQIWNEALTELGISNINVTKKERMITDEVTRNMGGIIASRYTRLEMRRKACEAINEMFNLDLDCRYREDYRELDDEMMLGGETGDNTIDPVVTDLRTRTVVN